MAQLFLGHVGKHLGRVFYDEAIEVDQRLLLFRAGTLAWTGAILAAAALARPRQEGPRRRAVAAALAASLGAALLARGAGGGPVSRAEIANVLGGQLSGPRCTVHFPREKTPGEADRILRDCEYDAAAVTGDLGLGRPPRAVVWIYRGAEEKRRLVGAGRTSFTKPWLAEVHVNDEGTPHPVLRHELVHALASAAATGPLGVPARAGVLVNAGLIEGLAVAVEVPAGPYSVHQWTRALRDQGRLPPLASLLGWSGFFSAAPARAYTAAGSFLRYLIDRYGSAPVLGAYRRDDVARALGRPLPELEAEWQRFLDGVVAPPALAALAEARFERGSLFARVCAREVAQLEADASRAAAASRAADSERLLRRASALSGGDPGLLRGAADAWRSAGDLARAEAIAGEALASAQAAGGHRALRASFLGLLGDLRLRSRDPAAAAERYRSALALGVEGAEARALHAKLAAAEDPDLADEVAPWLLGVGDPELALARAARGDRALAHYLLARARLARGAPSRALHDLHGLVPSSLPHPALAEEARRMTASALCLGGRWGEGIAAWTAIAREASGDGARAAADDAARRCAFEREEYGAPAAWEGDW